MFKQIQYKLLISYLLVLGSVLTVFATAVRIFFTHSLSQQLTDKLKALAQGAATNVEFKQGHLQVENDFQVQELLTRDQALQWFNTEGRLIVQRGKYVLSLPLDTTKHFQIQNQRSVTIQAITLPIIDNDEQQLIGYVRVSQSLKEFDETVRKLDLGLGGGIVISLVLSGVGGIFLTHQAMQPIEKSFQKLKQFTADASHELRSPLMAIKSNVTVALKYPEGMRVSDCQKLQAIASATEQMTALTEDLLLLARSDQINPQGWQLINLNSVLNNLVQIYEIQATAKQIHLQLETVENLFLLGDSSQITRLFRNLIDNALQYTPTGGRVKINASLVNQTILVQVQDTGIGIAPEHQKQIFERFWQVDRARSYHWGNSGLGLAIAQSIAKGHNGVITITSQLGIGSCLTVSLPAKLKTSRK